MISPEQAPNELAVLRGRNMGSFIITLEDVKGDVGRAERSFLKINQNATLEVDPICWTGNGVS